MSFIPQSHRFERPSLVALILLLALFLFQITTKHLVLQGCPALSAAEMMEQAQPSSILNLWQTALGEGLISARWLSMLIMAMCFAIAYRFTADLYGARYGKWAILINSIICLPMAFMGWTVSISLSSLLINISILFLWRATNRHMNLFIVVIYGTALLIAYQWGVLGLFMVLHGIYGYFFARTRRTALSKFLLGYGVVVFFATQLLNLADIKHLTAQIPWYDFYLTFTPELPLILVAIFVTALVALATWYADNRPLNRASSLLPIYIFIPLIILALGNSWFILALGAFAMPLAAALSLLFTNLPQRTKAFTIGLTWLLIVAPPVISANPDLQINIAARHISGQALVAYPSLNYPAFMEKLNSVQNLCNIDFSRVYYRINENSLILVQTSGPSSKAPITTLERIGPFMMLADEVAPNLKLPNMKLIHADYINDIHLFSYEPLAK